MTPDPAFEAEKILGKCCCHESYVARKMIDPNCAWHEYGAELIDALTDAFTAGAAQEREACADLVEHWVNSAGPLRQQLATAIRRRGSE